MKLYVGNASRQVHEFVYTVPEQNGFKRQIIEPGAQVLIFRDDLNQQQIDSVIKQHERYGMVPSNRIAAASGFHGLCYSIDKQVDIGGIARLMEMNNDALVKEGVELRKIASLVGSNTMDRVAEEQGGVIKRFQTTVIEDDPDPRRGSAGVAETIDVVRRQDNPGGAPQRSRKGRRG